MQENTMEQKCTVCPDKVKPRQGFIIRSNNPFSKNTWDAFHVQCKEAYFEKVKEWQQSGVMKSVSQMVH